MSLSFAQAVEPSAAPAGTACFSVTGFSDPGLLPRLMEIWAKRGLVPHRWHSVRCESAEIALDIEVDGLDAGSAERFAVQMRCVLGVRQVLVSRKGAAPGA